MALRQRAAEIASQLVKEVIQDKQTYGIFLTNDRMDKDQLHKDQSDWRVGQAGVPNPRESSDAQSGGGAPGPD